MYVHHTDRLYSYVVTLQLQAKSKGVLVQNQSWGLGVFNTMVFLIYAFFPCLMEAFKKEKESQTACPKCGEGEENTQGFEHSTIISLLKHDPILGFLFAPFSTTEQ